MAKITAAAGIVCTLANRMAAQAVCVIAEHEPDDRATNASFARHCPRHGCQKKRCRGRTEEIACKRPASALTFRTLTRPRRFPFVGGLGGDIANGSKCSRRCCVDYWMEARHSHSQAGAHPAINESPCLARDRHITMNRAGAGKHRMLVALRRTATLRDPAAGIWARRHNARRPLMRLTRIMTMATTRRMWMKPPKV
jgi:hypothetical protein